MMPKQIHERINISEWKKHKFHKEIILWKFVSTKLNNH